MTFPKAAINPFRLYTLAEAQELVGVEPEDLIRLAGATLLNLCVLVPAGRRAFAVDPASILSWDADVQLETVIRRSTPNMQFGLPDRNEDVVAVVLSWAQCQEVEDYGVSRQSIFYSAYSFVGGRSFGVPAKPMHVRPIRMPLFNSDSTPADQSRWRFAIYPYTTAFIFTDGVGYPEPEDLLLTKESLWILGYELARIPKPIDLSPLDVDVEFEQRSTDPVTDISRPSDAQGSSPLDELTPSDADAIKPEEQPKTETKPPLADLDIEQTPISSKAAVIREERGPVVLLPREEVERRINKGKSWIYERINPKHPRFDPTMPQPIRVGTSVGWIESEIDAWWQLQIQKGIEKTRGTPAE